jgi:release factor glutamine methyltransferase
MKVAEAEKHSSLQLQQIYSEGEAAAIASMLLEHVTGNDRSARVKKRGTILSPEQMEKLQHGLQRLMQHEPVQYVTGKAWFMQMELFVDNSVLIPRPETEELVTWIIDDVKAAAKDFFERPPMQADKTTQLKILDVGTGSGCIALALKKMMPTAEVWGCDISDEALNVARRNGSTLDIRVDFQGMNFLDESQHALLPFVDVIVSNPPYIPVSNKESMMANVLNFEPHTALFVPHNDVLVFYRYLAMFGKQRLYANGSIYMEIHEDLSHEVIQLFESEGYQSVELKKDMQGKDRMVKAVWPKG